MLTSYPHSHMWDRRGEGRYNLINAEMISHHDDYHVPLTSATYCKDHIPPCKDKNRLDQYWNDMPPWKIMYHFTPLTCCIDHIRKNNDKWRKKNEGRERGNLISEGGTPYMTSVKVIMHTWYWLLCDKFSDLLIETLSAVKPQHYVV